MGVLDQVRNRAQGNMAIGVASSIDMNTAEQAASIEIEEQVPIEIPEGGYEAKRLRQFHLASGEEIKPVNGYYIPKSAEEKELLEYYASKDVVIPPEKK